MVIGGRDRRRWSPGGGESTVGATGGAEKMLAVEMSQATAEWRKAVLVD